MAKFNPALLVPASQIAEFSKQGAGRTVQQVALDNIARMKEQFAAGDAAEGKVNFKLSGDRVAFTIRVSNTALVLERTKVQDTDVDVKEMTVPKANFPDALDYYADRIKAGSTMRSLLAWRRRRLRERIKCVRPAQHGRRNQPPLNIFSSFAASVETRGLFSE
ncbi:hypothetical protein ACVOMT_06000 [Sphingomonas panni]